MIRTGSLLLIPASMLVGLFGHGLWGMLAYGAGALLLVLPLRIAYQRAPRSQRRHANPTLQALAARMNLGTLTLYRTTGARIFTTSWRHQHPTVFVGETWWHGDTLLPEAVGAIAHELAHVLHRDVLWRELVLCATCYTLSLSLISPVGAIWPELFAELSLAQLGGVVAIPLVSWGVAASYSSVLCRLELRADRTAAAWCGAHTIIQSLRRSEVDFHIWIFSPHPPVGERVKQLQALAATDGPSTQLAPDVERSSVH